MSRPARRRAMPAMLARDGELIVERDPRHSAGRLLRQGDMDASYVDLADPSNLLFDYLRWMRIVLRAVRAHRVLHIGGGACALPRALAADDPHGLQEVCEVNASVLALAREHCGLRRAPGLHVRHADGRAFVGGQPDSRWDAIAIDAFVGAVVPRHLITAQACHEAARVAPLTMVNVVDGRARRDVATIAAALETSYPCVFALGTRVGNTIVVGCVEQPDLDLIAARAAADPSPAQLTPPATMTRMIAGVAAPRDEEPHTT